MEPVDRESLRGGALIGDRYRIAGLIGRGGMGEVYAAEDLRLQGKLRALKVNRPPTADGLYSAEEAALLMRLNHPRLPIIVDYFPPGDKDSEMLVMDYIDGETVQSLLRDSGGFLPESAVLNIGIQLCDALHYLHSQHPPIIHRDLKPTNVMVDQNGYVRLIDFGIARRYKAGQVQDTVKLGTPGFAAPEQEAQRQSDARTDVFGLGALMLYMLNGGTPLKDGVQSGGGLPGNVSADVRSVIGRMLDPRPNCRYTCMEEAAKAMAACVQSPNAGGSILPEGLQAQRSIQQPGISRAKPLHITVASFSPGAGSTFVAISLARLLGSRGIECAAVEHPSLEPEWYSLLNIEHRKKSAKAGQPLDSRYIRIQDGREPVYWHALLPSAAEAAIDDDLKFRLMMESINEPVVVTDMSGQWLERAAEKQLLQTDVLIFAVDPFPSKWTLRRMKAAQTICFEREGNNLATIWAANKDMKFRSRSEWLAMIPAKPDISIPLLPAEEWVELMWNGLWATSHKSWSKAFERSFHPFISRLFASS
ncbi:serine/threonine protein kinase [Paenibacillus sp. sptzw28]|uniref:serine/threonine-protein kinase n=1 Tax=Paenibacillus sp. sptzw28 TaxID=715179 RepID=UPI001C6E1D1B|nr:serine/threonine-protein kinase [Paenibacillus sp. sptzw28]QYR23819.1 serine/threonine protein kinase [Paenibacillus sp. sptzw28]